MNATRSPQKATDCGIKKDNLLKEARLSWYQSIYTKHLWVYVKFGCELFIPFARKVRSKKSRTFAKGIVCPFSKKRDLKSFKI
jgi:hypothetical protein